MSMLATALLLNVGKMPKDAAIYIGSIKVYDADWHPPFNREF